MPDRGLISKIKSGLLTSPNEEVVDIFKPVRYRNLKGILILTDKQVIFAEEKGTIFKSYVSVSSAKLLDLAEIEKLPRATTSSIRLGQFEVSSPNIEGLVKFYNERIFSQVQRLKGLVEYKGEWMTSEEKFEREQLDKGLVKFKGKWMTPEEKFEKEQKAKGLVKFMGRWGTPEQVDKWKKLYAGLTCDFMDRSPIEFEQFIAELFTKMGYSTSTTPSSADYGADVIAKKDNETIAIQVKRYKPDNKVGVKEVNQVLGSMYRYNADKAIVITTSDFTRAVRKLARTAPLELWNRAKLYEMVERYFFGEHEGKSVIEEISSKKREIIAWFRKGLALSALQKYQEAVEAYEWVLELTKHMDGLEEISAEAWNNKGFCLSKLGKLEDAMECFDKALEINPTLQIAKNNKMILQEDIEKQHVELHEKEEKGEAPITKTILAENLNLTAKGEYSEITILHVVENNQFQCPKSCTYFNEQTYSYSCPKRSLMIQKLEKDRLVCTTVVVKVRNISSQLLVLESEHFLAFDSFGNQYVGGGLCSRLHPNKYTHLRDEYYLCGAYYLYNDAQVTCLLCFPQLPPDSKIIRMVYNCWVAEKGCYKHVDIQDIKITR